MLVVNNRKNLMIEILDVTCLMAWIILSVIKLRYMHETKHDNVPSWHCSIAALKGRPTDQLPVPGDEGAILPSVTMKLEICDGDNGRSRSRYGSFKLH